MGSTSWLRLASDRLVRTDQVTSVDLRAARCCAGQSVPPCAGCSAHILVKTVDEPAQWLEAATVPYASGGALILALLSMLTPDETQDPGVRYVYVTHTDGQAARWTHGPTLPVGDVRVPAFHPARERQCPRDQPVQAAPDTGTHRAPASAPVPPTHTPTAITDHRRLT